MAMVRTLPVDAPTLSAPAEIVELPARSRLKLLDDALLRDALEHAVASHAATERAKGATQVQSSNHLHGLSHRILLANEKTMGDRLALEKSSVTCEQDSLFLGRDAGEISIVPLRVKAGVEAEQPQVPDKRSKVAVDREAGDPQGLRPQTGEPCDVETLEHGIDADVIAMGQTMCKVHRGPVHQDEVDLGVGNSKRLNGVLDRRSGDKAVLDVALAAGQWQEVVQLRIEPEGRGLGAVDVQRSKVPTRRFCSMM